MDAAVSLSLPLHHHAHGPLPLPHPAPHHLHCAVPLRHHATSASAVTAPPPKPDVQAPPAARLSPALAAPAPPRSSSSPAAARSSSRAATGYAAALADACVRAGTLRRAARHARALLHLLLRLERPLEEGAAAVEAAVTVAGQQLDARVAALVRMLVAKGRAGVLAEALAEFAAICDHLLSTRPRARHAY
jgi:hypothetical protein